MREYLHEKLHKKGAESPGNTSLIFLSHTLDRNKSWVLTHAEYQLTSEHVSALQGLLDQYLQGVPLPYILGQWDFFGRTYTITPDVLIPRLETEALVEMAVQQTKHMANPMIADVGTGSGAIAISLAEANPTASILALDVSRKALEVAKGNALRLGQTQIRFLQCDLLSSLEIKFDLICANLPYIPSRMLNTLEVSRWEPRLALDGGESGLDIIHALLQQAKTRLASPGEILLEIEASLGKAALEEARKAFPNAEHQVFQDLAGHDRIVEITQA